MTLNYEKRTTKTAPLGSGCLLLITTLAGAFILLLAAAVVNPVGHGIAALVHCPNAAKVQVEAQSGGSRRNGTQVVNLKVFTMQCTFADGTTKTVENDTIAITALAGGLVLGIVGGLLVGGVLVVGNRLTGTQKSPA